MSRSYKKNPYISDNSRVYKKIAHRTTRRRLKDMEDLPSRGDYNKCFESYYIHDYSPRWSKEEAIDHYKQYISEDSAQTRRYRMIGVKFKHESLEDYLKYWAKCSYRK